MPFVSTDQVLEQVRQILEERFEKRRKELANGPERPPAVKKWVGSEWGFPERADAGDYPKGRVNFDPERTFERLPQDSGSTDHVALKISIYFSRASMSADDAERDAIRYGDAIAYTLMREAKAPRPKDGTVLPGLFRLEPKAMRVGEAKEIALYGCEVDVDVIVDQQFEWLT